MSRQILLQCHLLRHFDFLNQSRTYLVAECPVSFCWPKFQSIFNPCNRPSVATDDRKQYQCQNIVVKNKTRPSQLLPKKVLTFYHNFIFFCHCLHRWERQLRVLTKVWKYLTRNNCTFRECSALRIRSSFKRFLHCGSKVLGAVQSTKCFVLKWETACRVSTCVVRSFLYLDTDFVDILDTTHAVVSDGFHHFQ